MEKTDVKKPLIKKDIQEKEIRNLFFSYLLTLLITIIVILILAVTLLVVKLYIYPDKYQQCEIFGEKKNESIYEPRCHALGENTENNVYLIKVTKNLTEKEACALESVLRLSMDKNVYVIDLNYLTKNTTKGFDYIRYLKNLYSNLNTLRINREEFLKGTGFEDIVNWNSSAKFGIKLFSIYKLGGIVLPLDLILLNRNIFNSHNVIVDEHIVKSHQKCNSFIAYLLKASQNGTINFKNPSVKKLIAESRCKFCHNTTNNCTNLKTLSSDKICNQVGEKCNFLKIIDLNKLPLNTLQNDVIKYCRQVVKMYLLSALTKKEVEDDLGKVGLDIVKSRSQNCICNTSLLL
uniref:Uncharacterized protein n=1 Tax=Clastoptera arizonana TaxID=38151 RepID=A0A1B6C998_9HEMI